ncbi:MAG: hypothetical protein U0Z75_06335 [Deinococcaceae bacterium]
MFTLLISLIQVFSLEQLKDPNFLGFLPPFVLVFLGLFLLGWIPFGMYCFGFLEKRKDSFNTQFFTSGLLLSLSLAYQAMQANCSGLRPCTVFEYLDLRGSSQVLIFSIFFLTYRSVFRSKNTFLEIFKNILFILIGIILSGTLVVVLELSTNLFGQIEGGSLRDYLDKNILWILIPSFALFVYEIRKRYSEIHRIFLTLFGWFSIPIFIISGVFVGFLLASLKQQNLFEGILSSGLYLGFGLVLVMLYNTFLYGFRFIPQDATLEISTETAEPLQEWKQPTYTSFPIWAYIFRIVPIIMLAFPALATYGLSVRVAEYGWTPERIWAAVGTLILTVVILSYIFLKNPADIRKSNGLGGWFFIVATIVFLIPGLTPLELSVKNQIERLLSTQDPQNIDNIAAFLRSRSGPYGKNAIPKLINDNRLTKIQKEIIIGTYTYKKRA